ncbi:MAG: GC-type dockerin domain-anchored protein [Phycisphaerales bacterium JB040]
MIRFEWSLGGVFGVCLCGLVCAQQAEVVLVGERGAEFRALGLPSIPGAEGVYSWAHGVSADGLTVVGEMGPAGGGDGRQAFRWSPGTGLEGIGDLEGGTLTSVAFGVNADGSVIVGRGSSLHPVGTLRHEGFAWDRAPLGMGVMTALGGYIDTGISTVGLAPTFLGVARGVSADGAVVIGAALEITNRRGDFVQGHTRPARWVQGAAGGAGGYELRSLGRIDEHGLDGWANGVSADGRVIVGSEVREPEFQTPRAFRWTESTGMVSLGDLNGAGVKSAASGVSADGEVVVGWAASAVGDQAFRWTLAGGMVGLGRLGESTILSEAKAVNADGSVIGGEERFSLGEGLVGLAGTVWTEALGWRRLDRVLEEQGVALAGWGIGTVEGVSADGRVLVGLAQSPGGELVGFRAVLAVACEADVNADGVLDLGDIQVFVGGYQSGDPRSDFNGDGVVDPGDVAAFVEAYLAGC